MSERAESLASAFEKANNELIAAVEVCTDEQWRQTCSDEGWSVGVTARHVASSHNRIAGFVQMIANDQPIPGDDGDVRRRQCAARAGARQLHEG